VLSPYLIASRFQLNPVWMMFAIAAFGYLFGFVGLLVAMPLGASIGVVFRFAIRQHLFSPLEAAHVPAPAPPPQEALPPRKRLARVASASVAALIIVFDLWIGLSVPGPAQPVRTALITRSRSEHPKGRRIPAGDIEGLVRDRLRALFASGDRQWRRESDRQRPRLPDRPSDRNAQPVPCAP
jgi:hypothetical protein